jgi:Cu2+-exporting ATPase
LKSATALERLARVDTVVFDKTGTLTLGRLDLRPDPTRDPAELRLAASIAQASRHPLARALTRACPDAPVLPDVAEYPGRGLSISGPGGETRLGSAAFCALDTADRGEAAGPELWLGHPGWPPHRFAFSDRLRPDAASVVARVKAAGLRVELLSGDRAPVVADVAAAVGIDAWSAGCDPAAKCARLEALRAGGRKPLMVGDGLNDAPALAAAFVSASPATAADVSQTAADVVFQGERLGAIVEILEVARRSEILVRQNLSLAILYNAAAVPLAIAGYVTPLLAAIAMSSSSLLVIGNALRLAWRRKGGA